MSSPRFVMTHVPDDPTITSEVVTRRVTGLLLRVMSASGPQLLPLPTRGAVVIGRAVESDVRIDDRSISRRHAVIHLDGAIHVEDLASANGTRVRGAPVTAGARVSVRPGDVIEFGTVLCAVTGELVDPTPAPVVGDIVVEDPAMIRLHALVDRVADGPINVLLLGETGVGKEVFAERVHSRSPRRDKPFVKINCAALTDTLIESELFGYEKGAFSGAAAAKPGLLETAEGGTLFLDEVGELSPLLQAKLLRVLEDRQVRRVGGVRSHAVDVRIVAATNRDLEAEIAAGRYRSDLYFRLNGFAITIPPLRERVREVAPLARRFARLAATQAGRPGATISDAAIALLEAYRWPGNIRELRNVIGRAVVLSSSGVITPEHLALERTRPSSPSVPTLVPTQPAPSAAPIVAPAAPPAPLPDSLRDALHVVERQRILDALDRCAGNQTRAAALLGISRRAFVSKLEMYNLPRPRKGRDDP
jgi:two-component system response regulator AtoC